MEIEQIYKNVDNIILTALMINDDAMKYTQSWGYNGFKRLHRCETKYLLCKHQELENSYFDKYRKMLNASVGNPNYNPISLKDHLEKWRDLLNRNIQELGELNQEHFDVIGITNCVIEDLIYCFMKKYEKVSRWIARFNESSWNSIEIHLLDDKLHEKMKKKEEEGD
jgi:hypothetical protein